VGQETGFIERFWLKCGAARYGNQQKERNLKKAPNVFHFNAQKSICSIFVELSSEEYKSRLKKRKQRVLPDDALRSVS
jgi:hypothetical protein